MLVRFRLWVVLVLVIASGGLWLASMSVYLPHVDDLFEIAWGRAVATGAAMPPHELKRFLSSPEYFVNAPRLHIYALSSFFQIFGVTLDGVLAFRAAAFVFTSAVVGIAAIRKSMPLVAVFFPAVLCIVMLHTGLRHEGTALALFLSGFVLLWGDTAAPGPSIFLKRTIAKTFVILSPLAAPSALAYGIGLLVVGDLKDLRRRSIWLLALEGGIALAVGVLTLGAMANFDYAEFFRVYAIAAKEVDLASFSAGRLINGFALCAIGAALWRRSKDAAFAGIAIGGGAALSFVLHNKISMSTPLTCLALLAMLDAVSQSNRWRRVIWTGTAVVSAVLLTNQFVFAVRSVPSPEAQAAVRTFADQARAEHRTLLVDEIAAIHGLKLNYGDAFAWSYSEAHPNVRPLSIERIQEGESWIVSTYTIHGWLKSEAVAGFPPTGALATAFVPGLPCLMGRNSCRLPAVRWGYYLVERRNGAISIRTVPDEESTTGRSVK